MWVLIRIVEGSQSFKEGYMKLLVSVGCCRYFALTISLNIFEVSEEVEVECNLIFFVVLKSNKYKV